MLNVPKMQLEIDNLLRCTWHSEIIIVILSTSAETFENEGKLQRIGLLIFSWSVLTKSIYFLPFSWKIPQKKNK